MALLDETAKIISNTCVGPRLWVVTLKAPQIAGAVLPAQFVHMRIPGMDDHILRRPFSIYAADAAAGTVDILYQVVGFGSDHLTTLQPGATCQMIGPVGTPWSVPEGARKVLIVGGGVGAAPVFMLTQQAKAAGLDVSVVLGAATKDALVTLDRYTQLLGTEPAVSTDDGTYGRPGFATSLVQEALHGACEAGQPFQYVAVCGPQPLMKIVAGVAADAGVYCQVSMERRMACGVGACLSCVVDTVNGKKRACVDGPVFDAQEVCW
ncbi:MAG: dihydroorotate dehydrogenase electron transfer subunit [Coriobacteriia bacterium]|nr:dihydroorotate dehydrogenase electron transfer subunit [Coriobacteriia bacterium]